MKVFFKVFLIVLVSCFIISCNKKEEPIPVEEEEELFINFSKRIIDVNLDEEFKLEVITNYESEVIYESSSPILKVNGDSAKGIFPGTCFVYAKILDGEEEITDKLAVNIRGEKQISDCYIRFTQKEMNVLVGEKVTLPIETDYPYELLFSYDKRYTIKDNTIEFNDDGKYTIEAYFLDGSKVTRDTILFNVKYDKEYVDLIIDDEVYFALKGESLYSSLIKIYDGDAYQKVPGTLFDGYYYDLEYTLSVDTNMILNESIEIHLHLIKEEYTFDVNKIIGFYSSFAFDDEIVCISPSTPYKITGFELGNYNIYAVQYDLDVDEYVVRSRGKKVLYPDGFLLCVRSDSDKAIVLSELLQDNCVLYLDSYTINKTKKITVNKTLNKDFDKIENLDLSCSFANIYDATNHIWLYSKNEKALAYPASTTKVITAITALLYCPIEETYTIGDELDLCYEGDSPSVANLKKGQVWKLRDLLYAMMLPSGNDAAYSVAACTMNYLYPDSTARMRAKIDDFARLMNKVAVAVGAKNSSFRVPDGNSYYNVYGQWDERLSKHFVCSYDMILFANYAFRFGGLAQIVQTSSYTSKLVSGELYSFNNTNGLLGGTYPNVVGLKTGTTNPAGYCLIAASFRNGRLIITSCLKATSGTNRNSDSLKMLKAAFGN